ncbi:MAG: TerB family tellurite resistance protein [Prolixibacteraceae bacterium]|nr:TerB family tellurite resistance protein [Prolixibacteraceae bacterium]MBN2650188.1 TerB family tellurite resistance protein [Prolixibacteraceae bacterium]
MAKFGKWIGAGLGAYAAGPIGAILGFVIGSAFDKNTNVSRVGSNPYSSGHPYGRPHRPTTGGYVTSLLVLVAAMMKADGKTLKSELNYVKDFFVRNFGAPSAAEAIKLLQDLLKQNIPVTDVCQQIRHNMDYSSRLQLMHFMFGIAQADGHIHEKELQLIEHIGIQLGINTKDYESIKSMFIKNTDAAYKILEIEPTASDDEVKKAYRRMAMKYHPDKVSYLGEDFQNAANEKFKKVQEAYSEIKKQRNIA